jgi:hypothetical protein
MTDTESLATLAPDLWVVLHFAHLDSRGESEERI